MSKFVMRHFVLHVLLGYKSFQLFNIKHLRLRIAGIMIEKGYRVEVTSLVVIILQILSGNLL